MPLIKREVKRETSHTNGRVFALHDLPNHVYLNTMSSSPKRQLFQLFAHVAKALAHPNRLELIEAIAQGERSVDALAKSCSRTVSNVSHHLRILRDAGLLVSRKEGQQVIYGLADERVIDVVAGIRRVAELHLAGVERIIRDNFENRDKLTPVKRDELLERVRSGEAIVLDVRPPEEYEAGHIPGAINITLDKLPKRLKQLPHDQEIVAYCRGPYCMLAYEAIEMLRGKGFQARRLEEGFPEWKARNLPVVTGTPD